MTVQTCIGIEGALVGDLQLVYSIVVNLDGIFRLQLSRSGETTEGESHEDTVEPDLISIDRLVPEYFIGDGARLVLQLLHHRIDSQLVLGFRIEVVHTCHEMTCTDIVEVIFQKVITANVAFLIDHRIGIFLTVLEDIVTTIGEISIQHTFEFDAHYIAPFGTL